MTGASAGGSMKKQRSAPRRPVAGDRRSASSAAARTGEHDARAPRSARRCRAHPPPAARPGRRQAAPCSTCADGTGVDDSPPVALAQQRRRARHETGGKNLQPQIAERERPPERHHQRLGPQPFAEGSQERERRLRGKNLTPAAAHMRQRAPPAGPEDRRVRQENEIAAGGRVAGDHRPGQPDTGPVNEGVLFFLRAGHGTSVGRRFTGARRRHYMLLGAEPDL